MLFFVLMDGTTWCKVAPHNIYCYVFVIYCLYMAFAYIFIYIFPLKWLSHLDHMETSYSFLASANSILSVNPSLPSSRPPLSLYNCPPYTVITVYHFWLSSQSVHSLGEGGVPHSFIFVFSENSTVPASWRCIINVYWTVIYVWPLFIDLRDHSLVSPGQADLNSFRATSKLTLSLPLCNSRPYSIYIFHIFIVQRSGPRPFGSGRRNRSSTGVEIFCFLSVPFSIMPSVAGRSLILFLL